MAASFLMPAVPVKPEAVRGGASLRPAIDIVLLAAATLARQKTLALGLLASELALPAHAFGGLAIALLGGLFVGAARPHFAEHALALHLLLQNADSLFDIVVPDDNLQIVSPFQRLT
jgi:hypothetical protein